jgi:uncharacterized membrane protein
MSVTQPPTDTPFGLQPNVAAGLAYLLGIVGGIVMLAGGGTNAFVKWAAAQSITMWGLWVVVWFVGTFIIGLLHLWVLYRLLMLWNLLYFVLWLVTFISGFQGREIRLPVVADLTVSIFKSALG